MSGRWADQISLGSVGAEMLRLSNLAKSRDENDLYNLAHPMDILNPLVRDLAALLYVERKERGYLAHRLNSIGEQISLGPSDYLMRCAGGHLWIRNIEKNRTTCPECPAQSIA